MRLLIFLVINFFFIFSSLADEKERAYFAGGCFWCVEESFEKLNGVEEVFSGYSGGTTENPTYKEVTYGNTGHFEVVEIIYDKEIIDKGYSYRSVAFYQNSSEKNLIEKSILKLEKKFNKKVVTYVRKFDKFFMAETRHQNYYKEYLLNYVAYKKACKCEEILKRIWSK